MEIVLIHGIHQNGKNPLVLKNEWIHEIQKGLSLIGQQFTPSNHNITMPFYGDALAELIESNKNTRGGANTASQEEFLVQQLLPIMEDHISKSSQRTRGSATLPKERGKGIHKLWLKRTAQAIEILSPLKGRIALKFLKQANAYLMVQSIKEEINDIVRPYLINDVPKIVISHSLGTVISYFLFQEAIKNNELKCDIPLFITMGSPLSLKIIQEQIGLKPEIIPNIKSWVNVTDKEDFIALGGNLNTDYFKTNIKNYDCIDNGYNDPHSLSGYISSKPVIENIQNILEE